MINKTVTIKRTFLSIGLALPYALLALFFSWVLQFDFMQSDVLGYWQDSLLWKTPFHSFHVPGYPLLIALINALTFNFVSPIFLMWTINLATYLISIFMVFRILEQIGVSEGVAAVGAILFGLWPFVGLTFTVFPIADLPVICFFLCGIFFNLIGKPLISASFLGLSLITHKAIWIFVFLFVISEIIRLRDFKSKKNMLSLILIVLPLAILWTSGCIYHKDPMWLISSNLETEVASRGQFPFLDGLLGTLTKGGLTGVIKSLLIIGFIIINVFTVIFSFKSHSTFRWQALAFSFGCLLLFLMLNQYEIWAAVRFSRILVIPLTMILAKKAEQLLKRPEGRIITAATVLVLFLSQFAYAWYIDYYLG